MPGIVKPYIDNVRNRVSNAQWGTQMIVSGEKRFYGNGITFQPRVSGTVVQGVVNLFLDCLHALLLLAGGYAIWQALT